LWDIEKFGRDRFVALNQETTLFELGFRYGINGTHGARTMMLDDLRVLLANIPAQSIQSDYAQAIVRDNLLGKPTKKARELALRHLITLYGFDPSNPIYRALRRLWTSDEHAQPLLAAGVALARDPLLRVTFPFFMGLPVGKNLLREEVEDFLAQACPERFSPASLKSFAQNVSGTWTAAGYLTGKSRKTRAKPMVYPENVTLCLFLGYLEGRSGVRLFNSEWMKLLSSSQEEVEALAVTASHRGLLVFMNAGGVQEVRFPGYLTPKEELIRLEASHDVQGQ
jgi:hypothetical protein